MWIYLTILINYILVFIITFCLCPILFGVVLWYNFSTFPHYSNPHLSKSDWSNMALIHVSHPYVILFLLMIGLIFLPWTLWVMYHQYRIYLHNLEHQKIHLEQLGKLYHFKNHIKTFKAIASIYYKSYHVPWHKLCLIHW